MIKKIIWPVSIICLVLGVYAAWRAERGGPKIIFIGIERASFDTLKTMFEAGQVPTFKKLVDNGEAFPLKPESEGTLAFWASVLTGTSVEKLALPERVTQAGSATSADLRAETIPVETAKAGLKTAVMATPFIRPPADSLACFFEAMPEDDPRKPKAAKPVELGVEIFKNWKSASEVPREVYQKLLPMNDGDWEDFQKTGSEDPPGKWSAARLAVAVDYNYGGAAMKELSFCSPDAVFLHFPGGKILEAGISAAEPGFSAQISNLVNLALYEEMKKSYLVFFDSILAEVMAKAGPQTLIVIVASPGRASAMASDDDEPEPPMGFAILSGPGVKKAGMVETPESPARLAPKLPELLSLKK